MHTQLSAGKVDCARAVWARHPALAPEDACTHPGLLQGAGAEQHPEEVCCWGRAEAAAVMQDLQHPVSLRLRLCCTGCRACSSKMFATGLGDGQWQSHQVPFTSTLCMRTGTHTCWETSSGRTMTGWQMPAVLMWRGCQNGGRSCIRLQVGLSSIYCCVPAKFGSHLQYRAPLVA